MLKNVCGRPVHHFRFLQTSFSASNSHFETNFGCFSAVGAETPKIGFLKGSRRLPFKKPIFIMRIADSTQVYFYIFSKVYEMSRSLKKAK